MEHVEQYFGSYKHLLGNNGYSVKGIRKESEIIYNAIVAFIREFFGDDGDKYLYINTRVLFHMLLDYFSDIKRLQDFHEIQANSVKKISYETYWILRRKPIQIKPEFEEIEDDELQENLVYANEKFVAMYIFSSIKEKTGLDVVNMNLTLPNQKILDGYMSTLYYHLKFRTYNPQTIELAIHSIYAGLAMADV